MDSIINMFWMLASGILLIMGAFGVLLIIVCGAKMAREDAEKSKPMPRPQPMQFDEMSRFEADMIVGRLLWEDKRRIRRRRYS